MFEFATYWDVLEFKLVVLLVTGCLAVYLGQKWHDKQKGKE